jgi:tetratricopeptide (TPR) repeat protein
VTMRYVYDNSAGNRRNPSGGTKAVSYGPLSTDEMGDLWLRLVPQSDADAVTLSKAIAEHELQNDLIRARQLVAKSPADGAARLLLGVTLLALKQAGTALPHLREAVRLEPGNDLAQLNLGNALIDTGDLDEAMPYLERATALNPAAADAHNNLGIALGAKGRLDEAIAQFRHALQLNPEYGDARRNLELALSLKR